MNEATLWAYILAPKVTMCSSKRSEIAAKNSAVNGRMRVWYQGDLGPYNWKCVTPLLSRFN